MVMSEYPKVIHLEEGLTLTVPNADEEARWRGAQPPEMPPTPIDAAVAQEVVTVAPVEIVKVTNKPKKPKK